MPGTAAAVRAGAGASWVTVTLTPQPCDRAWLRLEFADPLGCGREAAEGVEVQPDLAVPARVVARRQRTDEPVGTRGPHEVGQREPVLLGDPRARADTEPRGVG